LRLVSTADPTIAALAELRQARRRKRIANIHWVDAMYQVYVVAILGLVVLVLLSGAAGGTQLDKAGLADLLDRGPAVLGLLPALAVLAGLRSGSRGGPLALEQPDVRHVLMSAVPRAHALRTPATRQLRSFAFVGTVVGGAAGLFARHRLGTNPVELVASGAGFGLATVLLGVGCALVAAGRRIPRWAATLVGLVFVTWSIADVSGHGPTAPATFLGRMPLWTLHFDPLAIIPAVVGVVLAVAGLAGIANLSIEHAERRTKLVGQLRFAVTLQDLRTVLVLRRQLAQELPREDPWIGTGAYRRPPRFLVFSRGVRSVLRFPASRLVRLLIVGVIAGFAARGVWDGTLPLIVVAGLALWVAGLDAIEPLAQETDHPSRAESYPCDIGELLARHLVVPVIVMLGVSLVAGTVFVLALPSLTSLRVAAIALIPMAVAGTAGAVVSALMGAPAASDEVSAMLPPEFAGMKNVIRAAWPPAIALLGVVPIIAAYAAVNGGNPPWSAELAGAVGAVLVSVLVAVWVRFREDIHDWWKASMEEAKDQRSARDEQKATRRPASAKAAAADEDDDEDDEDDESWDEDAEADDDADWEDTEADDDADWEDDESDGGWDGEDEGDEFEDDDETEEKA
jgi:hypothetical protein